MYAAACNLLECLSLLLTGRSDVNRIDNHGNTALHYAYAFGSMAAASLLEERGSDCSLENQQGRTPLSIAGVERAVPFLFSF
jgi:ankyrin repeat protein